MPTNPYQPPGTEECRQPESKKHRTSEKTVAVPGFQVDDDDDDDSDLPPDWWLKIYWSIFWLMVAGGLLGSLIDYVKRPW
jgi:hypothetical protein